MQMLETTGGVPIRAFLGNENLRGEKHGKERRPMVDLKLSANFDGSVLDRLQPGLFELLFREPGEAENPDLADRNRRSVIRMPMLEPLVLKTVYVGYSLVIAHGTRGDASALKFDKVKMDGFVITPKAGGTFSLDWRAAVDPDGQLDLLASHMHSEIDITMTPPPPEMVQQELAPAGGAAIDGTR